MLTTLASQATGWAIRLPLDSASAVLALRLVPHLEVRVDQTTVWLRGRTGDETLQRRVLGLPACARYAWLPENNTLRPLASRLASEKLPADGWQPLRAWANVQLPTAVLPARIPSPVALGLVAANRARPANAWMGSVATFAGWASSAPLVRLARLRFAVCADSRCLVLGAPPPPVPGRILVADEGIVFPAGLAWQPRATPLVIRRAFGVTEGAILLWDEAGARILPEELFVSVTRSAVRATIRAGSASKQA